MISKKQVVCVACFLAVSVSMLTSKAESASAEIPVFLKRTSAQFIQLSSSYTGSCGGSTDTGLSCKKNERPICEGDKCECVASKDCGG